MQEVAVGRVNLRDIEAGATGGVTKRGDDIAKLVGPEGPCLAWLAVGRPGTAGGSDDRPAVLAERAAPLPGPRTPCGRRVPAGPPRARPGRG